MKPDKFNIVVCATGGGGNFQALIDARTDFGIDISLTWLIAIAVPSTVR